MCTIQNQLDTLLTMVLIYLSKFVPALQLFHSEKMEDVNKVLKNDRHVLVVRVMCVTCTFCSLYVSLFEEFLSIFDLNMSMQF